MAVFYITLISTYITSFFSRLTGKNNKYIEWTFISLVIAIFILVAGLRANIGDTSAYIKSYKNLELFEGFTHDMKDKGFILFQLILYKISTNPQFMIFITAVITQFFNIYTLAKYRNYFELQIYMYFASGCFLVSMNGIRQAMVAAILFFCIRLIIENRFIEYLIITIILSTMHASVLIMIPIYFIVRKEAWSKDIITIILLSSIVFLLFYQIMPIFFNILQNSTYSEYEDLLMSGGGGASFIRFIVNFVPVILSYLYRNKMKEKWPESNIFVNMSLINLIIMGFSLYNWIFARFSIYLQLYNFILLPYIISNCFENKKERNLIYYLFILCYFIFFYREQVIGGVGVGYRSNFF